MASSYTTTSNSRSTSDYYDAEKQGTATVISISSLPVNLRRDVIQMKLLARPNDTNNGDELDAIEIVSKMVSLQKDNTNLKRILVGVCSFAALLIFGISGATIVATRLTTTDTLVDPITGIAYAAKGSGTHEATTTTMKTEDVIIYSGAGTNNKSDNNYGIVDMTNDELMSLKEILYNNNDIKFQIKGYARSYDNKQVRLLVESGGTILYDETGIISATGNAQILFDLASSSTTLADADADAGRSLNTNLNYPNEKDRKIGCGNGVGCGNENGASNNGRLTQPPTNPPTNLPTMFPTKSPTTTIPTTEPTTARIPPTDSPTKSKSDEIDVTDVPTVTPPTNAPTVTPPTNAPTVTPPTDSPVTPPTNAPTVTPPTNAPTVTPPTFAPVGTGASNLGRGSSNRQSLTNTFSF